MPDAFFTSSKSRKRKRGSSTGVGPLGSKFSKQSVKEAPKASKYDARHSSGVRKHKKTVNEELSEQSDDEEDVDDMDLRPPEVDEDASDEEDKDETPAEKRLRLAQLYLDSVKETLADGEFDAAEIDKELISSRLKQDVLEHSGKAHLFIADAFDFSQQPTKVLRTRGHRFSVTAAVATESCKYLFTSGKDGSIFKWDLSTGKRLATFPKLRPTNAKEKGKGKAPLDLDLKGHSEEVLALALSWDGRYLASAGRDRKLVVWDVERDEWLKSFGGNLGHRDIISALSFRNGTHQLYTASFDRTLKVYDLSPSVMGYIETLFGHQDNVLSLDSLRGETCVSVGGRDKTVRYWKIVEETQLVFRGGGRSRMREVIDGSLGADDEKLDEDNDRKKLDDISQKFIEGSIECVAMIDESTFLSGGDSGSISLWTTAKKKPIFTHPLAHGFNVTVSGTEGAIKTPRWVTALASLRYSDVMVSGSWDGDVRIWRLDPKLKSFSFAGTVPIPGVINSLQLLSPPPEFFELSPWTSSSEDQPFSNNKSIPSLKQRNRIVRPLLLVAGVGQEHRLGRWLSVKNGVVNGSFVVVLSPQK